MKLSDTEIMQLAILLSKQVAMRFTEYRPDSPALIGHCLSIADEFPGVLENAFAEIDCLDEIATNIACAQKTEVFRFRYGVLHETY